MALAALFHLGLLLLLFVNWSNVPPSGNAGQEGARRGARSLVNGLDNMLLSSGGGGGGVGMEGRSGEAGEEWGGGGGGACELREI